MFFYKKLKEYKKINENFCLKYFKNSLNIFFFNAFKFDMAAKF